MPQSYRGKPRSASRVVLSDGRTAVLVPREPKHFSKLQNGYPLAEEYLNHVAKKGVEAVAVDDGDRIHVFDVGRYRRGNRVGHAPYTIKRVASLSVATTLEGDDREAVVRAAEWEWLTAEDLKPVANRRGSSSSSLPRESPGGSMAD